MVNAVVGETTPNYFKEILQFLYSKFGDFQFYSLGVIVSQNLKIPKDKLELVLLKMFESELLYHETEDVSNFYCLSIKGFEFCQLHKKYLGIKD